MTKSSYGPARRGLSPIDSVETAATAATLECYPARVRGKVSVWQKRYIRGAARGVYLLQGEEEYGQFPRTRHAPVSMECLGDKGLNRYVPCEEEIAIAANESS